jgi:hypothetical protein
MGRRIVRLHDRAVRHALEAALRRNIDERRKLVAALSAVVE